jgi:hypothetical protein
MRVNKRKRYDSTLSNLRPLGGPKLDKVEFACFAFYFFLSGIVSSTP